MSELNINAGNLSILVDCGNKKFTTNSLPIAEYYSIHNAASLTYLQSINNTNAVPYTMIYFELDKNPRPLQSTLMLYKKNKKPWLPFTSHVVDFSRSHITVSAEFNDIATIFVGVNNVLDVKDFIAHSYKDSYSSGKKKWIYKYFSFCKEYSSFYCNTPEWAEISGVHSVKGNKM